jgi:hypothetical protein
MGGKEGTIATKKAFPKPKDEEKDKRRRKGSLFSL